MDEQPIEPIPTATSDGCEDWRTPRHLTIPRPTYHPAMLALGMVLFAWGLVTSWWITVVGALIGALAVRGWILELVHERQP